MASSSSSSLKKIITWTDNNTKCFLEIFIAEQEKENWIETYLTKEGKDRLVAKFNHATGYDLSWKQFKNQYDNLKSWYTAYLRLARHRGVNINPVTGEIEMEQEWWDEQVQVIGFVAARIQRKPLQNLDMPSSKNLIFIFVSKSLKCLLFGSSGDYEILETAPQLTERMIPSSSPMESRHRLSFSTEKTSRRRFQRIEKGVKFSTLKLVLICIMLGALFTIYRFRYPPLQIAENPTSFGVSADPRYISSAEINWNHVSNLVEKHLFGRSEYQGIGLINLNHNEIDRVKEVMKSDCDHVALHLDYAAKNITWESLYPEWIDEVEEFEVPTCPSLPWIQVPGKPRIDLVIAKLPCDKSGKWSRDVARLHLQLAAARVAASSKGLHDVHVILVSDCFPIPNLFTGQELVAHQGNIWLYKPNLHQLRQKLQLPVGSCELSVPLQAKDNFYSASAKKEAYATILHSAQFYVCGAIAAAQSIRMSGSTRDLVILVDDSISEYHKSGLEAAGWKIHMFQRIRNPNAIPNAYNEWNYSKFRLWQLTEYSKIIFIDADMLILRNIDFLFEFPEISAIGNNATLFNSGLMVVEPSNSTFQLLMDNINEVVSYNGGDQGYLNEIFTWWHRIPKHMNFLKNFWEGDEPEIKKMKTRLFGADPPILYVLHYLGYNKPWLCFRDYDCNWNVDIFQEFASDEAHRTWWRVHDAMPENLHKFCLLRSKQKAQLEWDRRQAEKGNYKDGHWKIKIKDERLKTCFEDFCFWESMLWHWGETNTTDNSSTTTTTTSSPPHKTALSSL